MSYVQVDSCDVLRLCENAKANAWTRHIQQMRVVERDKIGRTRFSIWLFGTTPEVEQVDHERNRVLRRAERLTKMAACGGTMLLDSCDAEFLREHHLPRKTLEGS